MKHTIILLTLAVFGLPASGQKVKDPEVTHVKVQKVKDSLTVELQLALTQKLNGQNYKQIITPVLYKDSVKQKLPAIGIRTRQTRIMDARYEISYGKQPQAATRWYEAKHDTLIHYSYTIPYQDWMDRADLRLDRMISGCCSNKDLAPVWLAGNLELEVDLTGRIPQMIEQHIPISPSIQPVSRKWAFSRDEMIIDFNLNITEINSELFKNKSTLAEIVEAIRQIKSLPNTALDKIEITGYASPEGPIANNTKIAGERASALKRYILQQFSTLKESEFLLRNNGENWNGLRKIVAGSDMPYKEKVLYIIDNIPAEIDPIKNTSRKKQLMDLAGGAPYNYMKKNFFEKLRNACYISITYDTALDDAADTINQAIELIRAQEYQKALTGLLTVETDPRAWNGIGVCYLLSGQHDKAAGYLQKSADNGNVLAKENLLLIRK